MCVDVVACAVRGDGARALRLIFHAPERVCFPFPPFSPAPLHVLVGARPSDITAVFKVLVTVAMRCRVPKAPAEM
jgi:hypothetical protein